MPDWVLGTEDMTGSDLGGRPELLLDDEGGGHDFEPDVF